MQMSLWTHCFHYLDLWSVDEGGEPGTNHPSVEWEDANVAMKTLRSLNHNVKPRFPRPSGREIGCCTPQMSSAIPCVLRSVCSQSFQAQHLGFCEWVLSIINMCTCVMVSDWSRSIHVHLMPCFDIGLAHYTNVWLWRGCLSHNKGWHTPQSLTLTDPSSLQKKKK